MRLFLYDRKLNLHVLEGTITGAKHRYDVISNIVVPHFQNHHLADGPLFMDDDARPHRARIVRQLVEQESIETLTWPAMLPNMNPIKYVWDIIGRKLNERVPSCKNFE